MAETTEYKAGYRQKSSARLELFPAEILLQILSCLPDLASLDSIIHASPVAYRVFQGAALQTADAVLTNGTMCHQVRGLVGIASLIRSAALPPSVNRLGGFNLEVISFALRPEHRDSELGLGFYRFHPFAPRHLADVTSLATIRSILATARRLTCMARDCLEDHLERFRKLRPEEPIEPGFLCNLQVIDREEQLREWAARPAGRKVKVLDIGPPEWVEEQRAVRAFWRLQIIYDLKRAAACSMLGWDEVDCKKLRALQPIDMYRDDGGTYHGHAQDFFEFAELVSVLSYVRRCLGGQDMDASLLDWPSSLPGAMSLQRSWPVAKHPEPRGFGALYWPSPAVAYWGDISSVDHILGDWRPFQDLGFAFWSFRRLQGYGIWASNYPGKSTREVTFRHPACARYSWFSALQSGNESTPKDEPPRD